MKTKLTLILTFVSLFTFSALAQQSVTGKVIGGDTNEDLIGATVILSGTGNGDVTKNDGTFTIENVANGSYTLTVSFVGYKTFKKEITVNNADVNIGSVTLEISVFAFDQVVVSGTRQAEKLTETPATIEVISSEMIDQLPTFNPGELLARVKGVDFVRSGVVGTGINIRGFNSNFNAKNLQVNDGRFASLIATGLPLGPLTTQIKEDVERVEVILGPNAALFGPNAHNGLVHTITKDPRTSEGTTFALNTGNQSMFSGRFRHAQVINDRLAFKVTGEYTTAEEFTFADSVYIDRLDANGNLGTDQVTEGYEELELDNTIEFYRGEASLYYSVDDKTDIILGYGGSNSTYLAPTNVGRNQIIDWRVNYLHARVVSENFFAQVYHTNSKTEDTYSIDDRTKQYYRLLDAGVPDNIARGEDSFASGARFIDDSRRWNGEFQYNNTFGKA